MDLTSIRPGRHYFLFGLTFFIVLAAFVQSGIGDIASGNSDDGCCENCQTTCHCVSCAYYVAVSLSIDPDYASALIVLPYVQPPPAFVLEQEWFDRVDRPPQALA
jgi:hypothetical protein